MTEPQTWVLIGIFGGAIFSMVGWQTVSFNRNLTTAIGALRESMEAKFDGLRTEMNARFETVDRRLETMDAKIEALDRDVQAISRRVFGADPQ